MNTMDVVLLLIALISVGAGIARGLLRELLAIVGVVASILVAYAGAPIVAERFDGGGGTGVYIASAVVLFIVSWVALTLLGRVLGRLLEALQLRGIDRLLGGVFGLARAGILIAFALTLVVLLVEPAHPVLRASRVLRTEAPAIEWMGTRIPWSRARVEFSRRWRIVRGSWVNDGTAGGEIALLSPREAYFAAPDPVWKKRLAR